MTRMRLWRPLRIGRFSVSVGYNSWPEQRGWEIWPRRYKNPDWLTVFVHAGSWFMFIDWRSK